jgi:hypothetical protein
MSASARDPPLYSVDYSTAVGTWGRFVAAVAIMTVVAGVLGVPSSAVADSIHLELSPPAPKFETTFSVIASGEAQKGERVLVGFSSAVPCLPDEGQATSALEERAGIDYGEAGPTFRDSFTFSSSMFFRPSGPLCGYVFKMTPEGELTTAYTELPVVFGPSASEEREAKEREEQEAARPRFEREAKERSEREAQERAAQERQAVEASSHSHVLGAKEEAKGTAAEAEPFIDYSSGAPSSHIFLVCDEPRTPLYPRVVPAPRSCDLGLGETVFQAQRVRGHSRPESVYIRALRWKHWGSSVTTAVGREECSILDGGPPDGRTHCNQITVTASKPVLIYSAGPSVIYQLMRVVIHELRHRVVQTLYCDRHNMCGSKPAPTGYSRRLHCTWHRSSYSVSLGDAEDNCIEARPTFPVYYYRPGAEY